ncbi:STAS domain-containing protein [Allosediminivita pacifica]|uniref:Anti-anti-sigma regulatory factor n=1 Tax=Allosediminivita pacifica TaxID=1267769 RepID=A0A2T6AC56_9RHOB|nr:STAS domain-containing protein [Allosediminivita pacifica]PTX41393.1 anti-anti-sigma regulatory factor [Allosediminivita pacifica]GGB23375.1 hypothetical protein GCM10011324_36740 [Allosediminivita pacifica]
MDIDSNRFGDTHIVTVRGAVDSRSAGKLMDALCCCATQTCRLLVVDLSSVTLTTRAGMRGFFVAAVLLRTQDGTLRLRGATQDVRKRLGERGFADLLSFEELPANGPRRRAAHEIVPLTSRRGRNVAAFSGTGCSGFVRPAATANTMRPGAD